MTSSWPGPPTLVTATVMWSRSSTWAWTGWGTPSPRGGSTWLAHSSWSTAWTPSAVPPSVPSAVGISQYEHNRTPPGSASTGVTSIALSLFLRLWVFKLDATWLVLTWFLLFWESRCEPEGSASLHFVFLCWDCPAFLLISSTSFCLYHSSLNFTLVSFVFCSLLLCFLSIKQFAIRCFFITSSPSERHQTSQPLQLISTLTVTLGLYTIF